MPKLRFRLKNHWSTAYTKKHVPLKVNVSLPTPLPQKITEGTNRKAIARLPIWLGK